MTDVILSNALADLAEQVKLANEQFLLARRTTAESALRAGGLLIDAKDRCAHGEWLPFLKRAGINERTARNFMTLARSGIKPDTVADLGGIRAALEHLARERAEAAIREESAELKAEEAVLQAENEELREANAALEAEISALKAEIKRFSEMRPLFDKGGFEAVVAAKDEEIRVLKTRVERESKDKAGHAKSAKFWEKRARELGYSKERA
ncbi:hypothetical protein [Prosthecomicrobium pneumaticum]|uniref:DUF3102 domain-containing protein n=1 Tax=Prosthecomicrobium pneumaticum TaxID=81895 RepID=A0A7W9L399_9HYPH|nr:hypothetical protein [Prosthecomicrobium pneumaticum]MBB5754342.1 hypothetical protein [Prosthecomicrobium pneumaticum]